jgi:hypothetical protein
MPSGRAVPLTYRAIRLILHHIAESSSSESTLPPSVVLALETALRGPSLVGGDSYPVALGPEDATSLIAWCREAAEASSPRDEAVLRVAADVIEAVPSVRGRWGLCKKRKRIEPVGTAPRSNPC